MYLHIVLKLLSKIDFTIENENLILLSKIEKTIKRNSSTLLTKQKEWKSKK